MRALGIRLGRHLSLKEQELVRSAIATCRTCGQSGACRMWLDGKDAGDHPPGFCPNAGVFDKLREWKR